MNRWPRCREGHILEQASAGMRHTPEDDSLRDSDTIRVIQNDGHKPHRQPGYLENVLGGDGGRQELGRGGEERVVREAERRQAEAAKRRQAAGDDYIDRPSDPGAASSSDSAGSSAQIKRRGPTQQPRTRRTWVGTGAGWSYF